jgi:hypothetical protein
MKTFLAAVISFVLGACLAVPVSIGIAALMMPPPGQCPPPCDGMGFLMVGVLMFAAPLLGIAFAILGASLYARRKRRAEAAARKDAP